MSKSKTPGEREIEEFSFDVDAVISSGDSMADVVESVGGRPHDFDNVPKFASPVLELLAKPVLPELRPSTRARLMMQSPSRLFFYWSVDPHSFEALRHALGGPASDYSLALRLLNLTSDSEEVHAVEAEGSWWFGVLPDAEYRAEIGFYSVTRPFVRILFSNTISTPRKGPSPHSAREARWAISRDKFVELLNVAGFETDADRVDTVVHEQKIAEAVSDHLDIPASDIAALDAAELSRALAALAAGTPIEDLKWRVSAAMFAFLEKYLAKLSASAIRDNIAVGADEFKGEVVGSKVFGSSLVNFPRRRFAPISSIDIP